MATPFTFEAVADNIPVGGAEVSLTLDKSGNPRVAFCQQGSAQIVVAQRDGGTWTHQDVPGGFLLGDGRPCLAIDSQGNPQLGYRDLNSGVLMHAIRNSTGRWSFTPVPTNSDHVPGGGYPVRQLGRHNRHVRACHEIAETGVKYFFR